MHSPAPLILVGSLKFWGAPAVPRSSQYALFFAVQNLFSCPLVVLGEIALDRGVHSVCSWDELWGPITLPSGIRPNPGNLSDFPKATQLS